MTEITEAVAREGAARSPVLVAISGAHLVNDLAQSPLVASYPVLRGGFHLDYAQLGTLTLAYQFTSSPLQPLVGMATDRNPRRWSLAAGTAVTTLGFLTLAWADTYLALVVASLLLGVGSSVFHPEAARVARLSAGRRHGFAQWLFQTGGSAGSALGPLLVALIVLPHGQASLAWLAVPPAAAVPVLGEVGRWSLDQHSARGVTVGGSRRGAARAWSAFALLFVLILAKFFYLASLSNYFVFYRAARFGMADGTAQVALVAVLVAAALGGLAGGWLSDRIGARAVIASAFSAIVVYAQALMPHRVGLVSGLFFGAAFGMGGLAAAALGILADGAGIERVYSLCAFLPLAGLVAPLLPRSCRQAS